MSGYSIRVNEMGEIAHLRKKPDPVGVWVVFGGLAGSEGKGAICAHLAQKYRFQMAISNFMPNAGHTWRSDTGDKLVFHHLPMAALNPDTERLVLGAQSVIDPVQLSEEIEAAWEMGIEVEDRLYIHPRAMVLTEEHREWERENLQYISSTCSGSAAAATQKARREPGVVLARDHPELGPFVHGELDRVVQETINSGRGVLVEGSQGFELDINFGASYPYCTSRQCTPAQLVADCGIEGRLVTRSVAVVRSYPIRVGHAYDDDGNQIGNSGPWGGEELNWDAFRAAKEPERTTVTGKQRRIFEPDWDALSRMSMVCRPTEIALTFADYIDEDIAGLTHERFLHEFGGNVINASQKVARWVAKLEDFVSRPTCNPRVQIIKTGANDDQILSWI